MIPVDRNWLDLGGKPNTGRTPPVLCVMNGVQPSPQQMSWIAQCYRQQHDMRLTSITPYMVQERTLPDGTRVRMVSGYGADKVMVWTAAAPSDDDGIRSGIGVMVRDVFGQPINVILRPQGTFGRSSGKWTEKRVPALLGSLYPFMRNNPEVSLGVLTLENRAWQAARAKEEYAVTSLSGGSAYRNNTAVARYGGIAVFSVGQALASAHNDIVFGGNGGQYRRLRIRLYNERLTDLNGPSRDLLHVKEVTLNGWTYIDAHPQGGKFLAAREKRYSNLVGITDKLAWFQIDQQGNVTESDLVLEHEFTVHSVDPEATYPDGGPEPGNDKPFHYSFIAGAHIGFDGQAVAHMGEAKMTESESEFSNSYNQPENFIEAGDGGEDYAQERQYLYKFGGANTIALRESSFTSSYRTEWFYEPGISITYSVRGHATNVRTTSAEATEREILFAAPKKELYVVFTRHLRKAELVRTWNRLAEDYGDDKHFEEETTLTRFEGEAEGRIEIIRGGAIIWSHPVFTATRDFEHRKYQANGSVGVIDAPVFIDPEVDRKDRWFLRSSMTPGDEFISNSLNSTVGDEQMYREVIGSADPLTGAAVVQIKLTDALYLLAIDDTGVRNIGEMSALIPMGAQADYIAAV